MLTLRLFGLALENLWYVVFDTPSRALRNQLYFDKEACQRPRSLTPETAVL